MSDDIRINRTWLRAYLTKLARGLIWLGVGYTAVYGVWILIGWWLIDSGRLK